MNDVPLDITPAPAPAVPHHRPRIRLTAVLGGLAAVGVVVGFFLDWVTVAPEFARKYRDAQQERSESEFIPSPTNEDWKALAEGLVANGSVAGPDVFHYARTARKEAALLRERAARDRAGDGLEPAAVPRATAARPEPHSERALLLLGIVLGAVPVGGSFIAIYFLLHGLRRAKTPVLVLAMWIGAIAVAFPAAYRIAEGVLGEDTDPGPGLSVMLVSGFALFLAGVFGVKAENWWRVFLGFLVSGALATFLGYAYLRWGRVA